MSYEIAIAPHSDMQKTLRAMRVLQEMPNPTIFMIAPEPQTAAPTEGWTLSAPWALDRRFSGGCVRGGCQVAKQKKQKRKAQRRARRMQRRCS